MIAEENLPIRETPIVSISYNSVIQIIQSLMKLTIPSFKSYILSDFYKKRKLSEDDFTQIFIEQAQILIRKKDYPFNINGQYRDIANLSKGFSDFYFYPGSHRFFRKRNRWLRRAGRRHIALVLCRFRRDRFCSAKIRIGRFLRRDQRSAPCLSLV